MDSISSQQMEGLRRLFQTLLNTAKSLLTTPRKKPPTLNTFPAEIRLAIYSAIELPFNSSYEEYVGLFLSCRLIYYEAIVEIPKLFNSRLENIIYRNKPKLQAVNIDLGLPNGTAPFRHITVNLTSTGPHSHLFWGFEFIVLPILLSLHCETLTIIDNRADSCSTEPLVLWEIYNGAMQDQDIRRDGGRYMVLMRGPLRANKIVFQWPAEGPYAGDHHELLEMNREALVSDSGVPLFVAPLAPEYWRSEVLASTVRCGWKVEIENESRSASSISHTTVIFSRRPWNACPSN